PRRLDGARERGDEEHGAVGRGREVRHPAVDALREEAAGGRRRLGGAVDRRAGADDDRRAGVVHLVHGALDVADGVGRVGAGRTRAGEERLVDAVDRARFGRRLRQERVERGDVDGRGVEEAEGRGYAILRARNHSPTRWAYLYTASCSRLNFDAR